jgi:hypothetical protein
MSNAKWENNAIQFPRLLAEINATQNLDMVALAESMDLPVADVAALFDRADEQWENIKKGVMPTTAVEVNAFDERGVVVGTATAQMSPASIADIVSHAAQLVKVEQSGRRSSGDTNQIVANLEEAVEASGVLEIKPS